MTTVGDTILVAGGWDWLCPPGADCGGPSTPPHADGAAFDTDTDEWTPIADAPAGFRSSPSVVVGDDVYVLSQCQASTTCPLGRALLRYRSADDAWDVLPSPHEEGYYLLVAITDGLVAFSSSDEQGAPPDFRFVAGDDRWEALPDDPLPPVFDRFVVEYDGRLLLFGSPIARGAMRTKLAAAYDPESGEWEELTDSGTQGYQVWLVGGLFYLNPHFGSAGGGVYDPSTDAWSPLPDPPYHDMAGILGDDEAIYEYAQGWVLDTRSGDWLNIAARPDTREVFDDTVGPGPAQGVLVFGGQSWTDGEGQLVNDTWWWTPPAAP